MKNSNFVFWDVTSYESCKNRRFGGTYRLHHQGDKNQRGETLAATTPYGVTPQVGILNGIYFHSSLKLLKTLIAMSIASWFINRNSINFERCSSVSIVTRLQAARTKDQGSVLGGSKYISFHKSNVKPRYWISLGTLYGLDDWGVGLRVPEGSRILTSLYRLDQVCGAPKLLSIGYGGDLSLGVKRPGHETDHSHPTSAEAMRTWISTIIL
jgi:hypothetical protein